MQFDQLNRREVFTLIGGAAAWPLAARAQDDRVRRVGFLSTIAESDLEVQSWIGGGGWCSACKN
jgi:putative tryptophan/tyrosine transport system substrate-binding protein